MTETPGPRLVVSSAKDRAEQPPAPLDVPPGSVRMGVSTRVREVSAQEAEDFGISTDRFCTEIERGYLDADGC
ncbi:hypothetical protein [Streptomyces sp. NBC_00045]|uniref:hypothetical protein n=1 Tax=Streptomyces sp. NBC_00045 TaxID=2975625 RepID=UPI002F916E25